MPKLIIGCPVYKRDWILKHWFECIERQSFPLEDIGFVFELGPEDEETHQILFDWQGQHPEVSVFDARINTNERHYEHPEGHRKWSYDKYYNMIELRNSLLERVRCIGPDKYFSLDSDILLEDNTIIEQLWDISETKNVDAVSPLMYMTPKGTEFPSVMSWLPDLPGKARRIHENYSIGKLFQADVIMAAKMMNKPVYENINYRFNRQGEDLGWSHECQIQGYKLWCASHIYGSHIMSRNDLEKHLKDGDPRNPVKTYITNKDYYYNA
jgi:hypothetical protein